MKKFLIFTTVISLAACSDAPSSKEKVNLITGTPNNMHVVLPNCPDWTESHEWDTNYFNRPVSSNFGCADMNNLGAMVEDPNDLVKGKSTSLYDAGHTANVLNGYLNGGGSSGGSAAAASPGGSSAP